MSKIKSCLDFIKIRLGFILKYDVKCYIMK